MYNCGHNSDSKGEFDFMTRTHLWPLAGIAVLLAIMPGCGGGSSGGTVTPPAKPDFLYAITLSGLPPNSGINLLSFKVDAATGALSPSSTTPLAQFTVGLAVDPAAKSLYLSSLFPPAIDTFSIDAGTGVPTPTGAFSVNGICALCPPQSAPGVLALNPNGKFLYYGSASWGPTVVEGVGAVAVDGTTGALSSITGSPFPDNNAPLFVVVHPSGQFVYAEDIDKTIASGIGLQSISGFSVDPNTGALASVPQSPFPVPASANVAGFAVHPSGKFLYASTGLAANGILAWSVNSTTGGLTVLPASPFQPGTATFGQAFDPSGKFFYVSAGAAGGILGFTVDSASGALTPLPGSPFAPGSVLNGLAVDPSGRFLFAEDLHNKTINGFKMDAATGALTPLGSPTAINAGIVSMTLVQVP
jgi:6-phosphogluconolactonase (cycloisomerase 2 family)